MVKLPSCYRAPASFQLETVGSSLSDPLAHGLAFRFGGPLNFVRQVGR
jgi:hypothetical protein